ncbi:hypothetical protein OG618_05715 [Kitasatospora sp. NBC_01246]|uniref:hypothetical protein n=1 Tax=Kitasatospora sp. NBC_01246 TaxID=2903570 RepID=UPI002E371C27|nr:hypothetical protein [Kitasatospora sp. NBC_01246]
MGRSGRAGQYGTVEHPRLPHSWRQYAMGCPPGEADNEVGFEVRRSGPGGVGEGLVEHTAVGDALRLGPPLPGEDPRDPRPVATGLPPARDRHGPLQARR